MDPKLHIVFDGLPGPEAGRFVEVETPFGASVHVGEWRQVGKFWDLILTPDDFPTEKITPGLVGRMREVLEMVCADSVSTRMTARRKARDILSELKQG